MDEAGGGDLTGAAGKGHGRTGHAGTQFEPQTRQRTKPAPALPTNWPTTSTSGGRERVRGPDADCQQPDARGDQTLVLQRPADAAKRLTRTRGQAT